MAQFPYYRQHALLKLPGLKKLDGTAVEEGEVEAARQAVDKERVALAVMVHNACITHKLARIHQILCVHTELRQRWLRQPHRFLWDGPWPIHRPPDVVKMLQMWDYERQLTKQNKESITRSVQLEILREHRKASPKRGKTSMGSWRHAMSQVMLAQQKSIAASIDDIHASQAHSELAASKLGLSVPQGRLERLQDLLQPQHGPPCSS
ncbi:unnamed protein product, partial [Ostreobium quekettii]